jgi:hypothetical protein
LFNYLHDLTMRKNPSTFLTHNTHISITNTSYKHKLRFNTTQSKQIMLNLATKMLNI